MPRKPPSLDTAGGPQFDSIVEEKIDLSPADSVAEKIVVSSVSLIATLSAPQVSPLAPVLVEIIKSVASYLGFVGQRRKAERARDLISAIYELLQKTRSEYVKKEEFLDLFEDVLRRTAEQPDSGRRDTMRTIFLKIVEEPREHVENRLLIRLADELPGEALKALAVLDRPLTEQERALQLAGHVLAARMGMAVSDVTGVIGYLANENLLEASVFDQSRFITIVGFGAAGNDLMFILTPLGRTFVEYLRG